MGKRIRVELELDPEVVKALVESGSKVRKVLSDTELSELSRRGVVVASDYLSEEQDEVVRGAVGKMVVKAATKAAAAEIVSKSIDIIVDKAVDKYEKYSDSKAGSGKGETPLD